MCGIAGIAGLPRETAERRVREALRRLEHRGPDGEGIHSSLNAVIGMRRLSIIDLQCGDQPIYNEDKSVAVVCNGELYNYVEGFRLLESRGHKLQSGSDVNLIPHFYEDDARTTFDYCRGMFAAAIWDDSRQLLTLARDRAGKKPLFYAQMGASLAFASELPALLALLEDSPSISEEAISLYLSLGFVPHPLTIYNGVYALPPAHTLTFRPGGSVTLHEYWSIPERKRFAGTREEALELLDVKLREAVALRLRSDVPVGLFLSGGIDSGLVASYAAEVGARDLLCFVVEVADSALNEAPAAQLVAKKLGLSIETIPLAYAPVDAVEKVSLLYGQPFADSSSIPSYFVAKAAAAQRKCVLNGDGGDEVFAGYRRYLLGRFTPVIDRLPGPLSSLASAAGRRLSSGRARRSAGGFAARVLRGAGLSPWERYLAWTSDLLSPHDVSAIFPGLGSPGQSDPLAALGRDSVSTSGTDQFQKSDFRLIMADDLLPKMDMATMANSLEARSPFLDIPLVEFAWSLPDQWRNGLGETKSMLRTLARTRLPESITRAPKRGFEVPVKRWIESDLQPLIHDTLLSSDSRVGNLADQRRLMDFAKGNSAFPGNHAQSMWALLMLELFLRAPQPGPAF